MHANINTWTDRISSDFDNRVLLHYKRTIKKVFDSIRAFIPKAHVLDVYLLIKISFS